MEILIKYKKLTENNPTPSLKKKLNILPKRQLTRLIVFDGLYTDFQGEQIPRRELIKRLFVKLFLILK